MPILRKINVDQALSKSDQIDVNPIEVSSKATRDAELPFYRDSNYTLNRDAIETVGVVRNAENGRVTVTWEMQVAKIGEDGSPTQIIVPGPSTEHRGCAIRLNLVTSDGAPFGNDAQVVPEAIGPADTEPQNMVNGRYREFIHAPEHTVAAQSRGVARSDYLIRLSITVPSVAAEPDLEHDESTFEIRCFKHLVTLSA